MSGKESGYPVKKHIRLAPQVNQIRKAAVVFHGNIKKGDEDLTQPLAWAANVLSVFLPGDRITARSEMNLPGLSHAKPASYTAVERDKDAAGSRTRAEVKLCVSQVTLPLDQGRRHGCN